MNNQSNQDRGDAFREEMRERFEQARKSGKSPQEAWDEVSAEAHQEARERAPQMLAQTRSGALGLRNFLIVGVLAIGLAVGTALSVENRYAAPLCREYGAKNGLTFTAIQYPTIGRGSQQNNASGACLFQSAAGKRQTVSLSKLAPNLGTDFLMSALLTLPFTIPTSFVLVALLASPFLKRPANTR